MTQADLRAYAHTVRAIDQPIGDKLLLLQRIETIEDRLRDGANIGLFRWSMHKQAVEPRQNHLGAGVGCKAPMIPAVALEQAVIQRIVSLGTRDDDRERVVKAALGDFEAEARKLGSAADVIRHRLTTVQGEISNLVGVLKHMGTGAMASVREELASLEEERSQLRERLQAHTEEAAPQAAEAAQAAKRFIETWSSVGELLEQATPEERRIILQHDIEVVEIRFSDAGGADEGGGGAGDDAGRRDINGKVGTYALRLFRKSGRWMPLPQEAKKGTPASSGDQGSVLTEESIVCQSDSKAPRQGLEPWTKRLTVDVESSRHLAPKLLI
jgi:site-specific DNA recombinase